MIRLRPATKRDAIVVFNDLSAVTQADVDAHGMTDTDVLEMIDQYFRDGVVHVIVEEEEPLVVGGLALIQNQWICWLLAREGFWSGRLGIWRILRQYRRCLEAVGEPVHSYTASPHPKLGRYMAAMGYKEAEPVGHFRHFIVNA